MRKPILLAGLLIGLTACASEPPREGFAHRGQGAHRGGARAEAMGPRRGVFISPSGEPFRGGEGLKAWFAGADTDHDGAITAAEFQADALRFFQVLDANHDGVVDGFEITAYERTIAPEITVLELDRQAFGQGPGRGARRRGEAGPGGRFALINEPEPVANADENVDGRVTLEEWRRATARRFAVLDRTRSGRLTLESLEGPRRPKP